MAIVKSSRGRRSKNFKLVVPNKPFEYSGRIKANRAVEGINKRFKISSLDPARTKPIDLELAPPDFDYQRLSARDYIRRPFSVHWNELKERYNGNPPITFGQYVDHRQMDAGYAIANEVHGRRFLIEVNEARTVWTYISFRNKNPQQLKPLPRYWISKIYYIFWDGRNPSINDIVDGRVDGGEGYSTSSFLGRDTYLWATHFYVNGSISRSLWFPYNAVYPAWNSFKIGHPVPDYDHTLTPPYDLPKPGE